MKKTTVPDYMELAMLLESVRHIDWLAVGYAMGKVITDPECDEGMKARVRMTTKAIDDWLREVSQYD